MHTITVIRATAYTVSDLQLVTSCQKTEGNFSLTFLETLTREPCKCINQVTKSTVWVFCFFTQGCV